MSSPNLVSNSAEDEINHLTSSLRAAQTSMKALDEANQDLLAALASAQAETGR